MRNCNKSIHLHLAVFAVCSYMSTKFTQNCNNCKLHELHLKYRPMTEYRFTLQKYRRGTKLTCPKCGRKQCFVKYFDTVGQVVFPDYVGRCDHEHSCQYHYKPSEYFKDNPYLQEEKKIWKPQHMAVPVKPTSYIDREIMRRSLADYERNPLFTFLSGVFGKEETSKLFQLYHVGTSKKWGGATVFWQIDSENKVRTGKIMLYDPATGHRVKEPKSYVSWVHTELGLKDFNMKQCLFGENLLATNPSKAVGIVESEKSALIATYFMPDFTWLATGGMHGCFKAEAMSALKSRAVLLCPDLGAGDIWREKSHLLSSICSKVVLSDRLERFATEEQRKKGLDVADFLLMTDTPLMTLQKMIKRCPQLQVLIDQLQLQLVTSK